MELISERTCVFDLCHVSLNDSMQLNHQLHIISYHTLTVMSHESLPLLWFMILSVCNSGLSFSICDQLASKKQSSKGQARVSICRKGDDGLAGCPPWPDKVLVVWLGQPPWTKHDQRQSQSQSNQISKQSESESESKSKSFQSRLLDSTTTTTTSKQPAESRIGNHSIILKFWLRFWLGNLKSCRNPHHLPRSCLRVFCWARNESESAVCTWVIKIATAHPHTDTHTHTHTSRNYLKKTFQIQIRIGLALLLTWLIDSVAHVHVHASACWISRVLRRRCIGWQCR